MAEDIERVTPAQIEQLRKSFQDKVVSTNADFCPEDLERVKTDNLWMKRFVAAQENDDEKATQMLYETCQWRKEFGTNELDHTKLKPDVLAKGVLFIRNKDKWGKPLLVFKAKFHNKGVDDIEDVKKFIVYYFERIERVAESDQISVIFDMKDTGWSNMDMDFIRYLITLLKQYYPYFVNYLMIYEMPWLLKSAWNIIKGWLPPKFVDRVKFVDKKTIGEFIDEANQLKAWGGLDDYTYSFQPEVRVKVKPRTKSVTIAAPPETNGNGLHSPEPEHKSKKVSKSKAKFVDRDGAVEETSIAVHEVESSSRERLPGRNIGVGDDVALEQRARLTEVDRHFVFRRDGHDINGRLSIKNIVENGDPVIFKVKATSASKFKVRPTIGMLDAQDRAEIVITVNPGVELIGVTRERFQVEVTMLPRSLMRSGTDSESGSGGGGVRGSYDFSQTNTLWKQITGSQPEPYIELNKLGCSLDRELGSPSGETAPAASTSTLPPQPRVVMNEEEMRKGLTELEKKISDSTKRIVKAEVQTLNTYFYIVFGLLGFCVLMLIMIWWSMPSALVPVDCPHPQYGPVATAVTGIVPEPDAGGGGDFPIPIEPPTATVIHNNNPPPVLYGTDKKAACLET